MKIMLKYNLCSKDCSIKIFNATTIYSRIERNMKYIVELEGTKN
jgi:hypothetical protein